MALTLEDIPIGFPNAPKPLLKDFFEKLIAENRGVDPYGNKMDCVLFNSQSRGYYVNITINKRNGDIYKNNYYIHNNAQKLFEILNPDLCGVFVWGPT